MNATEVFAFGRRRLMFVVGASCLALSSYALACQVPVFRFALERWTSDNYQVIVLHSDPLSAEQNKMIESLHSRAAESRGAAANFDLHVFKVEELQDTQLRQAWSAHQKESSQPLVLVLYPRNAQDVPSRLAFSAALDARVARQVVDSPIRRELCKRLAAGQSAVWLFVPSGDKVADATAREALEKQLRLSELTLKLPSAEELAIEPEILAKNKIDLRVQFSILTMDREDERERFLLRSLLASEGDLERLDQPMAFPVFGRGRVLYALVGKGIAEETIRGACSFLVGPCSCQVKAQNPGFDLLIDFDWDSAVGDSMISDPLPAESAEPILLPIAPGRANR